MKIRKPETSLHCLLFHHCERPQRLVRKSLSFSRHLSVLTAFKSTKYTACLCACCVKVTPVFCSCFRSRKLSVSWCRISAFVIIVINGWCSTTYEYLSVVVRFCTKRLLVKRSCVWTENCLQWMRRHLWNIGTCPPSRSSPETRVRVIRKEQGVEWPKLTRG